MGSEPAAPLQPVVVGVAGGSGSGKSTVVREVVRLLGDDVVAVLRHDAYYRDLSHLPPAERDEVNFDHPNALESELLAQQLAELVAGRGVETPRYDFATHTRLPDRVRVEPRPVVLVDGILILAHEALRAQMDLKVFVDTDAETRLERRIRRDVRDRGRTRSSVLTQFQATVEPMHARFVAPSMAHADIVVTHGGYNREGVAQVVDAVRALLAPRGR